MRSRFLVFLALIGLTTPICQAAGFNLGASIGQSDLEDDRLQGFNDGDFAWKAFVGFRFFKFFGVEGGYQDFGSPSQSLAGQTATYSVDGWDVWAVGILPIKKFELFGKVGILYGDYRWTINDASGHSSESDLGYGIGIGWTFTKTFAMRLEYERFDTSYVDDLGALTIGVDFRL
ncbi:MAG: outer membrane beta-barrel protein [Acidobacteriota bacterium]|jgi:OOP family OmpA-OmpF porin